MMGATNIEAQEEVCAALWEFARAQKTRQPNAMCDTPGKEVTLNLEAVGEALETIMKAFGYSVVSIE
jgi:hypothetical protein